MSDEERFAVARRFGNDALATTRGQTPEAAMLLVDAAMVILLSCHHEGPARELVRMISTYMVELIDAQYDTGITVQ